MASIELTPRDLVVHVHGWDRALVMRSTLSVPLAHVTGVRENAPEADFDDAVVDSSRGVGTFLRGRVAAGSLAVADGRAFYDVHDPRRAIVVDLEGERFRHLVVEVDDELPGVAAHRIREALEHRLVAHLAAARADAPRRTWYEEEEEVEREVSSEDITLRIVRDDEGEGLSGWQSAATVVAAIVFLPVAAFAFVFIAPAMLPILALALPQLRESASGPGETGAAGAGGAPRLAPLRS